MTATVTATIIFHRYFLISPGHFIIANDDKKAINFRMRITKSDKKKANIEYAIKKFESHKEKK